MASIYDILSSVEVSEGYTSTLHAPRCHFPSKTGSHTLIRGDSDHIEGDLEPSNAAMGDELLVVQEIRNAYNPIEIGEDDCIGLIGKRTKIYAGGSDSYVQPTFISSISGSDHVEIISYLKGIQMVNIFVHRETSFEFIRDVLRKNSNLLKGENLFVWGNFNRNIDTGTGIQQILLREYGMQLLSPHLNQSGVDTIFVKLKDFTATVDMYHCFFSSIKSLFIRISKK